MSGSSWRRSCRAHQGERWDWAPGQTDAYCPLNTADLIQTDCQPEALIWSVRSDLMGLFCSLAQWPSARLPASEPSWFLPLLCCLFLSEPCDTQISLNPFIFTFMTFISPQAAFRIHTLISCIQLCVQHHVRQYTEIAFCSHFTWNITDKSFNIKSAWN